MNNLTNYKWRNRNKHQNVMATAQQEQGSLFPLKTQKCVDCNLELNCIGAVSSPRSDAGLHPIAVWKIQLLQCFV
jgi:hypothetical protein